MSRVRADKLVDRAGTGAVELTQGATLPSGKTISGSGTIAVNSSGTAAGLSGSPDITVNNVTGVAATFTGAVTVGGVLTYDDVTNVDSVGIVTARSGLEVTGIITARPGTAVTFKGGVDIKDATETVSTGSTTAFTSTLVTLECDVRNGTVFTHDIANGAVGIVSITNFPAVKNSFHTVSVIFTQGSTNAGLGNTTGPTGIGTNITLKPQGVSGISTVARVGSGTTVTLSTTTSDIDIVTFGIHYNGSTNTEANNYKTFATKNGGFRFG